MIDAKTAAQEKLNSLRPRVVELSHRIHANPETGFEEVRASAWISEMLAAAGFAVALPGGIDQR